MLHSNESLKRRMKRFCDKTLHCVDDMFLDSSLNKLNKLPNLFTTVCHVGVEKGETDCVHVIETYHYTNIKPYLSYLQSSCFAQ